MATRCLRRKHDCSKQCTSATFESHIEFLLSFQDIQAEFGPDANEKRAHCHLVSRWGGIRVGVGWEHMCALSMIITLAYFYIHNAQAFFCSDQCVSQCSRPLSRHTYVCVCERERVAQWSASSPSVSSAPVPWPRLWEVLQKPWHKNTLHTVNRASVTGSLQLPAALQRPGPNPLNSSRLLSVSLHCSVFQEEYCYICLRVLSKSYWLGVFHSELVPNYITNSLLMMMGFLCTKYRQDLRQRFRLKVLTEKLDPFESHWIICTLVTKQLCMCK